MTEERFAAVGRYVADLLVPADPALEPRSPRGAAAGLPAADVSPLQGRLLELLARAGLREVVEVRVGPALETLPQLAVEGGGPFDLVFIDADKQHTPDTSRGRSSSPGRAA